MRASGRLCGLLCLALSIVGFRCVSAAGPLAAASIEAKRAQNNLQVLSELASAKIAEPERVAAVLTALKLAAADLVRLDAAEADEVREAMRAGEVALGDRFRLRVLSDQAVQRQIGASKSAHASARMPLFPGSAAHLARQMQEDAAEGASLSGDTLAIMVSC
jgi:hypothetical protein